MKWKRRRKQNIRKTLKESKYLKKLNLLSYGLMLTWHIKSTGSEILASSSKPIDLVLNKYNVKNIWVIIKKILM